MAHKQITISNGLIALVDEDDYDKVSKFNWHYSSYKYAHTSNTRKHKITMHHLIMGKPEKGYDVDHINGNGLDNRKSNLRIVPHWLNLHNSGVSKNNKSGESGVHYMARIDRYWAYINIQGKRKSLGYYKSFDEAKAVRVKAKQELFREHSSSEHLSPKPATR